MSISGTTLDGGLQQTSIDGQSASETTGNMEMGREEFLKLLLTQMKHQDPLNPMEGQEFATHLAQFSSVEQLININETMADREEMTQQLSRSLDNSTAAGLIGKTVRAEGNTIQLGDQEKIDVPFALEQPAEKVELNIADPSGRVVRSIEQQNLSSGEQSISWDGRDADGNELPEGTYNVSVTASDSSGDAVSAQTYLQGVVNRVRFGEETIELLVGDQTVPLDQIQSVSP